MIARRKSALSTTGYAYAMASPSILLVVVIVMYPLLNGIFLSFHDKYLLAADMSFIGARNYLELFRDPEFLKSLRVTAVFVIGGTFAQLVMGILIAELIHHVPWGRSLFRSLMLLPWAVPLIVTGIVWRWMYNDLYGVINFFLNKLGLIGIYEPWLGQTETALMAVMVAYIWRSVPFMILVILAGLQSIDTDLYEAASIDGASPLDRFRFITVPGLRPVILIGVLLTAIWSFQEFPIVWTMTKGGPAGATEILPIHVYLTAFIGNEFSYGAAMATIMFVVLLIFSVFYVRVYGRDVV